MKSLKDSIPELKLSPIGLIRSPVCGPGEGPRQGSEAGIEGELVIDEKYADALLGMKIGDKIVILYWMHLAERDLLRVHPRGDRSRPLQGVFTTRSPQRPNPISIDIVEVTGIRGAVISVIGLDAVDGTPLLDIKCTA